MPKLSVIIPTYKRADVLRQCLEHVEHQTVANDIEVIVVSDGHDEATSTLFQIPNSKFQIPIHFFEIEKSQQGVARNKGVQEAESPMCLFIGDDAFLAPDACEKHLQTHDLTPYPFAVLGFTTWDASLEITPVMTWLEESGWQFGYPMIQKYARNYLPKKMQHRFTYTIHISIPTHLALAHPFREDVTMYGWEDIEWGKELANAGIKLFYEPNAKALHHHHITLDQSLKRMEELGRSIQCFPNSDRYPSKFKQLMYKILILVNPKSFSSRHRKAFLDGLRNQKKYGK
jgi:glycosyltransferase involved in cell wall biosynthesis